MYGQYLYFVYPVSRVSDPDYRGSHSDQALTASLLFVGMVRQCLLWKAVRLPVSDVGRFIYGGVGMGVCAVAVINAITLSNASRVMHSLCQLLTIPQRSYVWSRVCHFLWPFILIICGVRAIFMIWELNRGLVFFSIHL